MPTTRNNIVMVTSLAAALMAIAAVFTAGHATAKPDESGKPDNIRDTIKAHLKTRGPSYADVNKRVDEAGTGDAAYYHTPGSRGSAPAG